MAVIRTVMAITPTRIHMERIRRMTPTGGRGITGMATDMGTVGISGRSRRVQESEAASIAVFFVILVQALSPQAVQAG